MLKAAEDKREAKAPCPQQNPPSLTSNHILLKSPKKDQKAELKTPKCT